MRLLIKKVYTLILLVFFISIGFSQNQKRIDSIQQFLQSSIADTSRINALNELSIEYLLEGSYSKSLLNTNSVTAIVSAIYFSGKQFHAIHFIKSHGYVPKMLDKSRFNRRLHQIGRLLYDLFNQVGKYLKMVSSELQYIIDSFPVAVCDNIRITNSKLVTGNKWKGYTASMRRYFYGVKVQLLTTGSGIPVAFCFTPGKQADIKSLEKIVEGLPPEARVYGDSAYTDYKIEDELFNNELVLLKIQRKTNSKRKDSQEQIKEKLKMRKRIEVAISDIKKQFPRKIHAVTLNGFLIKLILFVFGLQINKITN